MSEFCTNDLRRFCIPSSELTLTLSHTHIRYGSASYAVYMEQPHGHCIQPAMGKLPVILM